MSDTHSIYSYEDVARRTEQVREIFRNRRVPLHNGSSLSKVLREASKLAKEWGDGVDTGGIQRLMMAGYANRISEAIISSGNDPEVIECFRRISRGSMDLSKRPRSEGKDALWEIELFAWLKKRGIPVRMMDPPDLVIDIGFGDYPIACKKIYSERGVEAQMRRGVAQLEPFNNIGIVAFDISDLTPEDTILNSQSESAVSDFLFDLNREFIERHQPKIQRFISENRCDGILVTTSVLTDIHNMRPRFNDHSQKTLWSLSSKSSEASNRLNALADKLQVHQPILAVLK